MYISQLTAKPEQQQFTIQSDVLTSTSSRRCGAISGHPLPDTSKSIPEAGTRFIYPTGMKG